MAMALRPARQPQLDDFAVRFAGAGRGTSARTVAPPEPLSRRPESAPKSVDHLVGRFCLPAAPTARRPNWDSCRFQIRGCVSRRIWTVRSMRRSDQPSRPSAMTCCFFSSLKTFTRRRVNLTSPNVLDQLPLAGFQVIHHWPVLGDPPRVGIPGDREGDSGMMPNARVNAESGMKPNSFRPIPEPRSASPESSLTPERRKSIAKKAAKARWGV